MGVKDKIMSTELGISGLMGGKSPLSEISETT